MKGRGCFAGVLIFGCAVIAGLASAGPPAGPSPAKGQGDLEEVLRTLDETLQENRKLRAQLTEPADTDRAPVQDVMFGETADLARHPFHAGTVHKAPPISNPASPWTA